MKETKEVTDAIGRLRREGRITEVSKAVRIAQDATEAVSMTEDALLRDVLLYAKIHGWKTYHARKARTSKGWVTPVQGDGKGFLDVVFVRERVVWAELKDADGRMTPEQKEWTAALEAAGQEVYLWRPSDRGEYERVLK